MSEDVRVRIVRGGGWADPLADEDRIYVQRRSFPGALWSVLSADGRTWITPQEGAVMDGVGFAIPPEALEPLAQEIDRVLGHASHADTEARVLREWLDVERGRVDEALKR